MANLASVRIPAPGPMFYCDNNVHRVGRSLRMLGYDTLLFGNGEDSELRQLAAETGRFLLTRDSDFEGDENALVLSSDDYLEQLKRVVSSFELDSKNHRYTLCLDCNVVIRLTVSSEHESSVPEWVVRENHKLWQCPDCEKLFWAGSHLERMDRKFDQLFSEEL